MRVELAPKIYAVANFVQSVVYDAYFINREFCRHITPQQRLLPFPRKGLLTAFTLKFRTALVLLLLQV